VGAGGRSGGGRQGGRGVRGGRGCSAGFPRGQRGRGLGDGAAKEGNGEDKAQGQGRAGGGGRRSWRVAMNAGGGGRTQRRAGYCCGGHEGDRQCRVSRVQSLDVQAVLERQQGVGKVRGGNLHTRVLAHPSHHCTKSDGDSCFSTSCAVNTVRNRAIIRVRLQLVHL